MTRGYPSDDARKAAHARKAEAPAARRKVPFSRLAAKLAPKPGRRVGQLPTLEAQLDVGLGIFDSHNNGVQLAHTHLAAASLHALRQQPETLARTLSKLLRRNGWAAAEAAEFASMAVHEAQMADAHEVAQAIERAPIRRTLTPPQERGFRAALDFLQSQLDEGSPPTGPFRVEDVRSYAARHTELKAADDPAAWRAGVVAARREAERAYANAGGTRATEARK